MRVDKSDVINLKNVVNHTVKIFVCLEMIFKFLFFDPWLILQTAVITDPIKA